MFAGCRWDRFLTYSHPVQSRLSATGITTPAQSEAPNTKMPSDQVIQVQPMISRCLLSR